MYEHRMDFSVARMARVLEISESGYYKWINRRQGPPSRKDLEDRALTEEITKYFRASRGSFGIRKITKRLNENGAKRINHKRVERLMREHSLFSKVGRKFIATTDSRHDQLIADNLLSRDFTASMPNEKMVSDTTVIKSRQGYLYVAGIMDLYGRVIVGMAMSRRNDKYLVMDALKDMLSRGCGAEGCFVHSDRGATYCSEEYRKLLSKHGLLCSMSRKGDCWDNAPMESFWGKMKNEWLKPMYDTIAEAKRDVYEYVWSFYPYERPHSSNGDMAPMSYYCQA